MLEYWLEFQKQIKICNSTMKITDQNVLKQLMIERMLPEYTAISLDNVIKKITDMIYFQKLKQNASKDFQKWVGKQIDPSLNKEFRGPMFNQICKMSKELISIDEVHRELQNVVDNIPPS